MDKDITGDQLIQLVKDYSLGRANDVARGAETPRLAALLVQKYGRGVIDAVELIYERNAMSRLVAQAVDDEVTKLDPLWRDHARERWQGRPADVVTFGITATEAERGLP